MTPQTCAPEISAHVDGGPSGGSRVRRPGSEDPHWRHRKLYVFMSEILLDRKGYLHSWIISTLNENALNAV